MICKKCSAPNNDNSSFCEYCGTSLSDSQNINNHTNTPQSPIVPNNNTQSQPTQNNSFNKNTQQNNNIQQHYDNIGTLTIIRDIKFGSLTDVFRIYINKRKLQPLSSNETLQYHLPFGIHEITIDNLWGKETQFIHLTPSKPNITITVTSHFIPFKGNAPKILNIQYFYK